MQKDSRPKFVIGSICSMRITKKIFNDLAIFMILLGICVGIVFPFFCLALGVPREIVLTPIYFVSCMLAGITLAILNITLSRKTVALASNKCLRKCSM